MERKKSVAKKARRKEKLLACGRTVVSLIKDLQEKWDASVAGLLAELEIHALLLKRIRHQFRRSKFVQRSLSIQSCARRLRTSNAVKFRGLISATDTFGNSVFALFAELSNRELLMRQMGAYAELTGEASTQAMAQEHYFFFGTDLSMLATSSRIWALSRVIAKDVQEASSRIREALLEAGLRTGGENGLSSGNSVDVLEVERLIEEPPSSENSSADIMPIVEKSQNRDTSRRTTQHVTSDALGRFAA
ncbi:hypothetical protein RvY_02211-2 [Ramazzottius varieornatus]|uniref:Uncharacterized protein n=1 Tax=Ramazzottius varieornatus TaxID=947166 RepID=A0A1D1UTJ3_RAMVA|nr:hypothetical protein RvY_02211-2 [Ramazzottius varieornatus]